MKICGILYPVKSQTVILPDICEGESMLEDIRALDNLGRIVLPSEIRKELNLRARDQLYVSFNGYEIVIRKQGQSCVFCSGKDHLEEMNGKYICKCCIDKLSKDS